MDQKSPLISNLKKPTFASKRDVLELVILQYFRFPRSSLPCSTRFFIFFFLFFLQVMERTFRTMGLHPTYLEAFKATHEQILTGDGPISLVDRHHLALMVKANLIYYLHCPSSLVWFYKKSIFFPVFFKIGHGPTSLGDRHHFALTYGKSISHLLLMLSRRQYDFIRKKYFSVFL